MRSAVEKNSVVKNWPSQSSHFAEKTPTLLSYHTNPPTWGGNVKPKDEPRVSHFKLGLQENVASYYARRSGSIASSALGGYLTDHKWKHPALPAKRAVDFSGDYLTRVVHHLTKEVLPSRYGESFLQNQQISYVITVPAIWSDKAKDLTRQAAIAAGIPRKKLTLITEPEAAALFCASLCQEVDLEEGDLFLICDAGGGTVDLISYRRVVSQTPFAVEECTVGTGAACGSIYLDQGFENLLKGRFGKAWEKVLTPKRLIELVRYFDSSIKRQFNPLDTSATDTEFEVPIAGVDDIPWIGFEDGYLRLTKDDIQSVFSPIFDQILGFIADQIGIVTGTNGAKLKTLFLVGGLGSNVYLHKFLEKRLKSLLEVKQPEAGYSAIMRGAVLYKLGLDLVRERAMRMSYGVNTNTPFRPGYHPGSPWFMDKTGIPYCRGVLYWFALKGNKLASGSIVEREFSRTMSAAEYLAPGPLPFVEVLQICDDETPPEYDGGTSLKKHCTVTGDLRQLPVSEYSKGTGPEGEYYKVAFSLGLVFGAGGIEFRLLSQGKVIGAANCGYF